MLIYCLADGGRPEHQVTVRHAGKVLHTFAVDLGGAPTSVSLSIDNLAEWMVERTRRRGQVAAGPRPAHRNATLGDLELLP